MATTKIHAEDFPTQTLRDAILSFKNFLHCMSPYEYTHMIDEDDKNILFCNNEEFPLKVIFIKDTQSVVIFCLAHKTTLGFHRFMVESNRRVAWNQVRRRFHMPLSKD